MRNIEALNLEGLHYGIESNSLEKAYLEIELTHGKSIKYSTEEIESIIEKLYKS